MAIARLFAFQAAQKLLQAVLEGAIVSPSAEVWNEILPHFTREVLTDVRVERLPRTDDFEWHQSDRKKNLPLFPDLSLTRIRNLSPHPLATVPAIDYNVYGRLLK